MAKEVAQQVVALVTMGDHLSSIHETHMEGENRLHKLSSHLYNQWHAHPYIHTKQIKYTF